MQMWWRLGCLVATTLLCNGAMAGEKTLTFTTVEAGATSGIDRKLERIIRTDADWKSFWQEHKSNEIPAPPAPAVDFTKNMVIAVFAGTKPSSGYAVKVEEVKVQNNCIQVMARLTKPEPGSMNAQMMTQPYDLVKCQAQDGALKVVWKGQ